MSSDMYFYAFKFVSGAFAFTLLTFIFRTIGIGLQEDVDSDDSKVEDTDQWYGLEELEIVDIYAETSDIKTFRLKRKEKLIPMYSPGQFLSFEIPHEQKVFRSYSVSASTENRHLLQVSIKKIPDGIGSNWFHSLKVGDKVKAHPPSGLFTDDDLKDETRVFVAGGVGITPLVSMLQTSVDRGLKHPIYLFYGARTLADLAFHEVIKAAAKRYPNIKYIPVLSDEAESSSWEGLTGYLTLDIIKEQVKELVSAKYFFCGPPVMTNGIMEGLSAAGVSEDNLHSEEFVSPTSLSEDDIQSLEATILYEGKSYKYSGKKNILDFFEGEGLEIPFACRSGVCGACKLKCKSGEALSLTNSGLNKSEQKDHILTCVSWPKGDLEFES